MASSFHPIRDSLEGIKAHIPHLNLEDQLIDFAIYLPENLSFPFSGVIAFQVGDSPVVQACYCPGQVEFTDDQPFNVLSVGKLFTATAIMQLIEEEKLSLTTTLSELLTDKELDVPLSPPYSEENPSPPVLRKDVGEITIEQLLTHRSGLGRMEKTDPRESFNSNQIGKVNYSNFGYQLMASIIGKYSDDGDALDYEKGFRSHIERRIFKPADMEGAIREIHSPQRQLECFEVIEKENPVKIIDSENPAPYPHGNGCWTMTASDLLAFERAIRQHDVLIKSETLQVMKQHEPKPLGFMRDLKNESIIGYGHSGIGEGMSSVLWTWETDPPITAAVLSNYHNKVKDLKDYKDVKTELDRFLQV